MLAEISHFATRNFPCIREFKYVDALNQSRVNRLDPAGPY
jgi:hypothetical protein